VQRIVRKNKKTKAGAATRQLLHKRCRQTAASSCKVPVLQVTTANLFLGAACMLCSLPAKSMPFLAHADPSRTSTARKSVTSKQRNARSTNHPHMIQKNTESKGKTEIAHARLHPHKLTQVVQVPRGNP
jgi:hypothetical protein